MSEIAKSLTHTDYYPEVGYHPAMVWLRQQTQAPSLPHMLEITLLNPGPKLPRSPMKCLSCSRPSINQLERELNLPRCARCF